MKKTKEQRFQEEREYYLELANSSILFVEKLFGFIPQPPKPEYKHKLEYAVTLTGQDWENAKELITADWFGDYHEEDHRYDWFDFQKGKHITWQQYLIMLSYDKALAKTGLPKISIASGHGIGKSSSISWLVLHFLFGRYGSQVACTAPTATQMNDVLWKELSIWISKMPKKFQSVYEWNKDYIRMSEAPNQWFARAKTSSKENSEALAGVHADWVLTIADEACHDASTEVLTDSGWKLFKDLSKKDHVMTLDNNGFGVYQKPTHYHEYDHDGEMVSVDRRGMNFMVTKNHDLYVKPKGYGYRKIKAENLTLSDVFIPRTINFIGSDENPDENLIKLYAWFISEGSFVKNVNKTLNGINISQSKVNQQYRNEIENIIHGLGYKPRMYPKDIVIGNTKLAYKMFEDCGSGFKNKKIPKWIKQLSPYYLNIFLDTFVKGDGYTRGNRDILYTSSPQLADDLHEIILKTGVNSVVTKRKIKGQKKWIKDHWATSSCDGYIITRTKNNSHAKISKKNTSLTYYKGKVYCVTVPNGIVMTRRNGYAMWSGNSGVEEKIFDVAQGAWTSGNIVVILISNPTRNSGFFYETHHKYKDNWQRLQFSSIESPIVDPEYEGEIAERHGRLSEEYGIRVLGKFPSEGNMDDKGFLPLVSDRHITSIPNVGISFRGNAILGVDPSGEGDDKTVFVIRDQTKTMMIYSEDISNEKTIAEKILTYITEYNIDPRNVVVDDFGSVGAKVAKEVAIASNGKIEITPVNVGDPCDYEDEREMYENKRAFMYWKMREWIIAGGQIVENKSFVDEIKTIKYKRNIRSKIQMMSKLLMRKLYKHSSPNIADALAMTFLREIREVNEAQRILEQELLDKLDFDPFEVI